MIHFHKGRYQSKQQVRSTDLLLRTPYGERIEERESLKLYSEIGDVCKALDTWSFYIITAYEDAEKHIGRKADKNRKIYNGMMKTYLYQFIGPKPPKQR